MSISLYQPKRYNLHLFTTTQNESNEGKRSGKRQKINVLVAFREILLYAFWFLLCNKYEHFLYLTLLLRRKLLAELVEDEKVAMEIARLEEEFRRLTEENRTLVTVHNERAQQLESLCLTNRTRQDSSWPLTAAEPETSEHPADARARKPTRNKGSASAHSTQQ